MISKFRHKKDIIETDNDDCEERPWDYAFVLLPVEAVETAIW